MASVGVRVAVTVDVTVCVRVGVSDGLAVEASVGAAVGVVICPNWAGGRLIGSARATGNAMVAGASMVTAKVKHANDRIVSNRCIDIPSCNTLVHYAAFGRQRCCAPSIRSTLPNRAMILQRTGADGQPLRIWLSRVILHQN